MRTRMHHPQRRGSGQVLPIAVMALFAMVGMTALVIDGGNAWMQQRITQNGADAASAAGAVVLAQALGGATKTDAAVLAAVSASAATNGITLGVNYYSDYQGNLLTSAGATTTNPANAVVVGAAPGGAIPPNAQGVRANGSKSFSTYFAGIAGVNSLGVGATATTVAGRLTGTAANVLLPITFPVVGVTCNGQNREELGSSAWPIIDAADATPANESIVPLCSTTNSGSVGWLDFGCGNLPNQIAHPCNVAFDIPTWLPTTTGNNNSVQNEMDKYDGQIIYLPLFDGTCRTAPPGTGVGDCTTGEGVGNNTYYHIPWFVGFLLDHSYIQGNNSTTCGGNGATGCLKGWFVQLVLTGPVGQGGASHVGGAIGIQLIK